jgi:hypothetical protein
MGDGLAARCVIEAEVITLGLDIVSDVRACELPRKTGRHECMRTDSGWLGPTICCSS